MVFGILVPEADEWRILERMRNGERLYITGVTGDQHTDAFTWQGNLSRSINVQGTHLIGRQLNSLKSGKWIVYDLELNQCVLTHEGSEALRLYRPSSTSDRCVPKKPRERG